MRLAGCVVLACACFTTVSARAQSNPDRLPPEQVPAKSLPVPTDVSPEMQRLIAAPLNPDWNKLWKTGEEWRVAANKQAAKTMQTLPAMRKRLHVTTEAGKIGGVRIYTVASATIPPAHRDKVLLHVHGGCYVLFPGESGTSEAVLMAGMGHYKVISVDYRMPPEGYFPAALDDAMTVLYEQVTDVNVFPYQGLCCCRCVCCCSPPGLYSHSDELIVIKARCRLGFERRVDAAIYQTVLRDQNAHAVIGTRCRRNG